MLFILIVLFMPKGILGLFGQAKELLFKTKPAADPVTKPAEATPTAEVAK